MSATAAEHIHLDADVLHRQSTALDEAASTLRPATDAAAHRVEGTAFGAMNAGLSLAINGLVNRTADLGGQAAVLAARMGYGVDGAVSTFTELEQSGAQLIAKVDEGGR